MPGKNNRVTGAANDPTRVGSSCGVPFPRTGQCSRDGPKKTDRKMQPALHLFKDRIPGLLYRIFIHQYISGHFFGDR